MSSKHRSETSTSASSRSTGPSRPPPGVTAVAVSHEARRRADGRASYGADAAAAQPGRRLRLPGLRVAGPGPGAPAHRGVLRERRQGGHRGGDPAPGRPRLLRSSTRSTTCARQTDYWLGQQGRITEPMVLRAGSHALRADRVGRGVRADRRAAATASPRPTRRSSTPPARPPTRRRSPTSSSCAPSAPTTCPTAPTCATSRPRSRWPRSIGIGKGSVSLEDIHDAEADRDRRPEPGHQPPADAHRARDRQAQRREDHRGQPAARGRAGPLQEPAEGARSGRPRHRPRRPAPAGPDQRRPRALPGDRRRCCSSGTRVDHDFVARPHRRLRGVGRARARARLGRRTTRDRARPRRRSRRRPGCSSDSDATVDLLGDGHHPAPQRGRDGQGDRQRRAAAGQHRQARRRPVPGARPLQRAGRPHDGHLGAAAGALPRRAAARSSASTRRASTASTP